jgi:hypothetical protein
MPTWIPIHYRDFWTVPRIFWLIFRDRTFLFDCPFDERVEDFPDHYEVYEMPSLTEEDVKGSWVNLHQRALANYGTVPLKAVRFDETRRQAIDAGVLEGILTRSRAPTSGAAAETPAGSPIPS